MTNSSSQVRLRHESQVPIFGTAHWTIITLALLICGPRIMAGTVLFAWGSNNYGQSNIPEGLSNVVQIAAGDSHNLALSKDGTLVGWGYNAYGQSSPPVVGGWSQVAAGNFFSLGVLTDGTVRAWGLNNYSQTSVPVGLPGALSVGAGEVHSLAQLQQGGLAGW